MTEARSLCRRLTEAGYPTMLAGGCVRDRLMSLQPQDFDLATAALPSEVLAFCRQHSLRALDVGLSHGTVTVVTQLQQLEITTLRHDITCDGRHAEVAFTRSFEEDAKRRDFTINALFEDADGQIHDFTGGIQDLAHHQLRFVGDPSGRIQEDYLRALRYFRFLSRWGWAPREDALNAIQQNRKGLSQLSAERVQGELNRIFTAKAGGDVIPTMWRSGVLGELFPQMTTFTPLSRWLAEGGHPDPSLAWYVLLISCTTHSPSAEQLGDQLRSWRFSRKQIQALTGLHRWRKADGLFEQLSLLLRLVEREHFTPTILLQLMKDGRRILDWSHDSWNDSLIRNVGVKPQPDIPVEVLQELAPRERGWAVELAKIYWYLDLRHAKDSHVQIIKDRTHYLQKLEQRDLAVTESESKESQ